MIPGTQFSVHSILRPPVTCSKIDYNVYQEDGVREAVEHHPPRGEIVVKEGDGHREDDEVGDEQEQHAEVPVKSEIKNKLKF